MSLGHGASIVRNGLVMHLDAANVKSYPGSGTTWTDLSGNGNHGTLVAGVSYNSSSSGIMVFDGIDGYISTNYAPNLDNNRLYTYEVFFKDDIAGGFNSNLSLISNYGSTATTPYSGFHINVDGTIRFAERNAVSSSVTITSSSVVDNTWKHIVGVADSQNIILYINGLQISTGARPGGVITSGQSYVLGSQHLGRFQSCQISVFRIYVDKALSTSEIQQNFNAIRGRYGI